MAGVCAEPAAGVPPRDQDDVDHHQVERREAHQSVQVRETVLSVRRLEARDAGHQHDLGEQQHGRHQPGEAAERVEPGHPAAQVADAAVGVPPVGDQQQAQPQGGRGQDAHGRVGRRAAPHRGGAAPPTRRCGGHVAGEHAHPAPLPAPPSGLPSGPRRCAVGWAELAVVVVVSAALTGEALTRGEPAGRPLPGGPRVLAVRAGRGRADRVAPRSSGERQDRGAGGEHPRTASGGTRARRVASGTRGGCRHRCPAVSLSDGLGRRPGDRCLGPCLRRCCGHGCVGRRRGRRRTHRGHRRGVVVSGLPPVAAGGVGHACSVRCPAGGRVGVGCALAVNRGHPLR